MQTHDLKSWPEYFQPLFDGIKTFEIRKNDRRFGVGDVLRIREWDDMKGVYTGREVKRKVTYILAGIGPGAIPPLQGLHNRFVVMALAAD